MSYQKHNWVTREIIRRQYLQNIEDGIYNEQERAIAAEVELGAALSTETSRAVAKENQINGTVTDLSNALTNETSRATTKESALETSIGDEITRATTAETQLSSSLSSLSQTVNNEISRATQAESDLHDYVDQKVTGLYKPSGSVYFADLPGLAASRVGNVYDIIDAFTTTSDFREGAGKSYGPGTNVVIIDNGGSLKYDVLPGFVDTSSFYSTGDTNEATIAAGDYFPFYDVSASAKRKSLWSNIVSNIKSALDKASSSTFGVVKVDGSTITANNGVISATGSTIAVDSALSTTSENPVQNKVITTNLNTKYDTSDSASTTVSDTDYVPMSESGGTKKKILWSTINTKLESTFATLTKLTDGSVTKVGTSTVGSSSRPIYLNNGTPTQVSADKVLFFSEQACSATTGNFCTISNSAITADHIVTECVFSKPSTITTDVTWTTANGSLTLNGTCTDATCTATITLCKKDN